MRAITVNQVAMVLKSVKQHNDFLAFHATDQPERIAAIDAATGVGLSYRQMDARVSRLGSALLTLGVQEGDRVACLARNSVVLVETHLACSRIGAVFVPLNWRLSAAEVGTLAKDADPALMTGDEQLAQTGLDGIGLDELSERSATMPELAPRALDPDRPSLILFTSGTSGKPKGAVLSEQNLTESAINFSLLGRVTHQSRFLCDAPMFHVIGLVAGIRPALMRGGSIVVSDGFDPERTLHRLADGDLSVTHYFCVPQMAAMLHSEPTFEPTALRGLVALFTGGAPHPAANVLGWLDEGITVADGFGMSEAGTIFGMPPEPDVIRPRAGSVGIPTPRVCARIVDDDDVDVAAGEPGELQIRGANVFTGYWRNPEATAAAFTADGWFRTGDIARADHDGFHWIVDRKKDMFISGGENVYPAEIETALAGLSVIKESAVIGVPDARWGEVGHLFAVCRPGLDVQSSTLLGFLEARIARYKIPKHVSFVDALPRNAAGKVEKNVLRSTAKEQGYELE